MSVKALRDKFGTLPDGREVDVVTLESHEGVIARIVTLGATLQSLFTPDAQGRVADIVLGYDTPEQYLTGGHFIGASIGRYANRIAFGQFALDGENYKLPINNAPNCLHGGPDGFDKRIWTIVETAEGQTGRVVMSLESPDGDQGFPGTLKVRAIYELTGKVLKVSYEAVTDKATVVNMTNHAYFNLAGVQSGDTILEHLLQLDADKMTPVNEDVVPTGELRDVAGTALDFTSLRPVGASIRDLSDDQINVGGGYDHNWVVKGNAGALNRAAELIDPVSGRKMELYTTAPGIQFYSGNYMDGSAPGKGGIAYRQSDALCLEPQHFPDAPNKPDFPSARLDPGETYRHDIELRFSVVDEEQA